MIKLREGITTSDGFVDFFDERGVSVNPKNPPEVLLDAFDVLDGVKGNVSYNMSCNSIVTVANESEIEKDTFELIMMLQHGFSITNIPVLYDVNTGEFLGKEVTQETPYGSYKISGDTKIDVEKFNKITTTVQQQMYNPETEQYEAISVPRATFTPKGNEVTATVAGKVYKLGLVLTQSTATFSDGNSYATKINFNFMSDDIDELVNKVVETGTNEMEARNNLMYCVLKDLGALIHIDEGIFTRISDGFVSAEFEKYANIINYLYMSFSSDSNSDVLYTTDFLYNKTADTYEGELNNSSCGYVSGGKVFKSDLVTIDRSSGSTVYTISDPIVLKVGNIEIDFNTLIPKSVVELDGTTYEAGLKIDNDEFLRKVQPILESKGITVSKVSDACSELSTFGSGGFLIPEGLFTDTKGKSISRSVSTDITLISIDSDTTLQVSNTWSRIGLTAEVLNSTQEVSIYDNNTDNWFVGIQQFAYTGAIKLNSELYDKNYDSVNDRVYFTPKQGVESYIQCYDSRIPLRLELPKNNVTGYYGSMMIVFPTIEQDIINIVKAQGYACDSLKAALTQIINDSTYMDNKLTLNLVENTFKYTRDDSVETPKVTGQFQIDPSILESLN